MCGIYAVLSDQRPSVPETHVVDHRGPDSYRKLEKGKCLMEFWRLAINGLSEAGEQPSQYEDTVMVCNGEIYNHVELGGRHGDSDCAVIQPLFAKHGLLEAVKLFNGDFALAISDGERIWAARDRVGVRPLFYTRPTTGGIAFASEVKSLLHFGTRIEHFPPAHVYDSTVDSFICYAPMYHPRPTITEAEQAKKQIHDSLIAAVKLRMERAERPVGFFLSGGLDSSLIAAIAARLSDKPIRTFSIGFAEGRSPDLEAARKVAAFLGTEHTEIKFTLEEGLAALKEVIWHLETYDTTTIRASIPMYLMSKYVVEKTDIRVVLSGEGSDELFGGYLYFHNAPDSASFTSETNRLVRDVYMFDVLRADRCTAGNGIELRVPFFDPNFIELALSLHADLKRPQKQQSGDRGLEKLILRDAFVGYLPDEILYRQKNGMSDAVGYNWVDGLRAHCAKNWVYNSEKKLYHHLYVKMFGKQQIHLVPYQWLPRWSGNIDDPSARKLAVFSDPQQQGGSTAAASTSKASTPTKSDSSSSLLPGLASVALSVCVGAMAVVGLRKYHV